MQYYATQVALYQTALLRPAYNSSPLDKNDFKQIELLYACLRGTKSIFDLVFSIDYKDYIYFSLLTWTCMRCGLIALQRLSIYEDPEWSLTYVRETLDFMWVLDEYVDRIEKAAAALDFNEDDPFSRTAKKMRVARVYCQEKMGTHSTNQQQGPSEYADLNLLDDLWFQDAFAMYDYPLNGAEVPNM